MCHLGDALPWHSRGNAVKQEASHTFYRGYVGESVKQCSPEAHRHSRMCLTKGSCNAACIASAWECTLSKNKHVVKRSSAAVCAASVTVEEKLCGE